MKKLRAVLAVLCVLLVLVTSSCDRVKETLGFDRMESSDKTLWFDNKLEDSSEEEFVAPDYTSRSPVTTNGKYYALGETMTISDGVVLLEYTLSNVRLVNNINDLPDGYLLTTNITFEQMQEKEKICREEGIEANLVALEKFRAENYDKAVDEDGNIREGYVFVLVDVSVKYLETIRYVESEHTYYAGLTYHHGPKYVMDKEDKFPYSDHYYTETDGTLANNPSLTAHYWSSPGPYGKNHFFLGEGETTMWQDGAIIDIECLNKYGIKWTNDRINGGKGRHNVDLTDAVLSLLEG